MEIEQLRQLEAVVRVGSLSAAAEELHVTQPSLTRSIQKLERELGCELFNRTKNRAVPNAAGRLVAEHARAILHDVRLMRDALDEEAHRGRPVRVGACMPAPLWYLTSLVARDWPGYLVDSSMLDGEAIVKGLLGHSIDLGIVDGPSSVPGLRETPFMEMSIVASLPPGHHLADRISLTWDDLHDERIMLCEDAGTWRTTVQGHVDPAGLLMVKDRVIFNQLAHTTEAVFFTADAPELYPSLTVPGRTEVAIDEVDARFAFYLLVRHDERGRGRELFEEIAD